jgi:hypothetical protein
LLNTVDIPLGTSAAKNEQKPSKGNDDYTQWVVVKALTARTFSYRTADNPTLMQINFDELDLRDAREVAYSMPQRRPTSTSPSSYRPLKRLHDRVPQATAQYAAFPLRKVALL